MKNPKVEEELRSVHPDEPLHEEPMGLVEDGSDLPAGMVRQILQGRQARMSGQATEYKFG